MWPHLSDEALIDALDGAAGTGTRQHIEGCAACRARRDEVRDGLALAEAAEVPEPSPLYWEAMRRQVARKLDADPAGPVWLKLRFWPAFAAAAAVVLLAVLPQREATVPVEPTLPAWSALPASEADPGHQVLAAIAPELEEVPGSQCALAECLATLSDEESAALAEALQAEIGDKL